MKLLGSLLLPLLALAASSALGADLAGEWEFATKYLGEVSYARVTLKADGEKLTGNLNELKLEGSIKGKELMFNATRPNGDRWGDFTGRLQGDQLEGTAVRPGDRKLTWSAKRPATPPATPRVHDFEPTDRKSVV